MEMDNVDTIVGLVAKGEGFAVLSHLPLELSAHKHEVVPLPLAPALKSEICMAVSTRASLSQANRKLVKLTEEIGRSLLTQAIGRRAA
jgi:DNA-binding transcriptional LysR family regulator